MSACGEPNCDCGYDIWRLSSALLRLLKEYEEMNVVLMGERKSAAQLECEELLKEMNP